MTTARDNLARIICESWDDQQCSCVIAPETRGSLPRCKSPFAAADAILSADESVRLELARKLAPSYASFLEATEWSIPAPPSEDKP